MRYWLYKCNVDGGPAGYWGDWRSMVFVKKGATQWGGSYSTESFEVWHHLDETVAAGDVVVAYQTDTTSVVGFCSVTKVTGPSGDRRLWLKPIEYLDPGFKIHQAKKGTVLESSAAVSGPVMLRELERNEMAELVRLAGAPKRVLKGQEPVGGYSPTKAKGS